MNFLSTHIFTSISGSSGNGHRSNVALITNIFLTTLITSIFTPELHSLLVSAISWTTVAICCYLIRHQTVKNGDLQPLVDRKMKRKATALVGSVLLSGICERVVGPAWRGKAAWWNKAGLPLVTRFLRNHLLGDPGILEGRLRGSKRLLAIVSVIAFLALSPLMLTDSSLALGLSNVVFQSLVYVLMEDIAVSSVTDTKNSVGAPVDLKSLALGGYLNAAVSSAVGFVLTSAYFEKPLKDYAANATPAFSLAKLTAIGILGGLRLLLLPLLISSMSSPSGSMLDLSVTLVANQITQWESIYQFFGTVGSLALIGLHFTGASSLREAMPQAFRPARGLIAIILILLLTIPLFTPGLRQKATGHAPAPILSASPANVHPIRNLIEQKNQDFEAMRQRQSLSLHDAIRNYKGRYGMPPPPGFDKWYQFAITRDSPIIDEYDTIFHQIQPFWGMPPKMIRDRAREALGYDQKLFRLSIRRGQIVDVGKAEKWKSEAIVAMFMPIVEFLSDMDLAFNLHDEPRIVVPSEDMDTLVTRAKAVTHSSNPKNSFKGFPHQEVGLVAPSQETRFLNISRQGIWSTSKLACPNGTPARDPLEQAQDAKEKFLMAPIGFIANKTAATDVCLQPSLQHRHGLFQRPNALLVSHDLIPVFSESKVSCYSDFVYPSPFYFAENGTYYGENDGDWEEKKDVLFWRGSTTGGYSTYGGWKKHHRQRIVGYFKQETKISKVLQSTGTDKNAVWKVKDGERRNYKDLFDIKFNHIGQCDDVDCQEQEKVFGIGDTIDLEDQWPYKHLLDIDGNAFSGRFYSFLQSNCAVFKASMFREWHDDFLVPWVHYVPLTLEMNESVEVMRYFTAEKEGKEAIKRIAEQGKYWAEKALRKEDMQVWLFRLLLEYGRVIDDDRENIGLDI